MGRGSGFGVVFMVWGLLGLAFLAVFVILLEARIIETPR